MNITRIKRYLKKNDDSLNIDNIKEDYLKNIDVTIELDEEYNLNITNFTLQCFEKKDEKYKKIEKSNTISDGLNKMLNDYKTNINEFFSVITDKKKSWSQFIQNIKLRLSGTDNKLTMEIKLYLDFPKSDNILITYKDPVEDIKEEVLKDFYKKIDNCKSFDEKINAFSNYKLDKEFFSAEGSLLNLTIVNKSDIGINSLKIIKEIDSFYDCDELLNIYKQFKRGELSPLFIFKEDLNLKNEDLGEISGSRELKITNKRYKVLYYLIKNLTDSLSEDFKEILGYFYLNENDFDNFFKDPLNKYNTTDKLDNKVFDCDWLNELYLYLTDKKKYCIEILKFNQYTFDKLFEFNIYFQTIVSYSSLLKFYEYHYLNGINVEDLYKNLLNCAKSKFEGLYKICINDFITSLESAGNLSEDNLKTKIENYFAKPIDIKSKLNITTKNDNLIDIIECIYGKAIEDYFTIKDNDIYLNINELFLQKLYKHLIDKVTVEENKKIDSYNFDQILEFTNNDNKEFIEHFDKIVDKYIKNYENINEKLKTFNKIKDDNEELRLLLLPDYYAKTSSSINAIYIDKFKPKLKAILESFFTTYFKEFMTLQENTIKGLDDISKYHIVDKDTLIKEFVCYLNNKCRKTSSIILKESDILGVDFDKAMTEIDNFKKDRQKKLEEELLKNVDENVKIFIKAISDKIRNIKESLTLDIENIKTKEQYNQFKYKNSEEINNYITAELSKIDRYSENYNKYNDKDKSIISNINNNKKLCCDAIVNALNLKSNEVFIVKLNYNFKEQSKIKEDIINLCKDFINKNKTYDSRKTYGELYKYIIDSLSCIDNIFKGDQSIKDSTDVINEDELSLTLEIKKFYFKDEYKEKPYDPKDDDPKDPKDDHKDNEDSGGNNSEIKEIGDTQIKGNNRCYGCYNSKKNTYCVKKSLNI